MVLVKSGPVELRSARAGVNDPGYNHGYVTDGNPMHSLGLNTPKLASAWM